jgi:hypothetical protein
MDYRNMSAAVRRACGLPTKRRVHKAFAWSDEGGGEANIAPMRFVPALCTRDIFCRDCPDFEVCG